MIVGDDQMNLKDDDVIDRSVPGVLQVKRIITLNVCRCRQCDDKCSRLAEPPHLLCVHCNNNHSQREDPNNSLSKYLGPIRGKERAEPKYVAGAPPYMGGRPDSCPICGTYPPCEMDCR